MIPFKNFDRKIDGKEWDMFHSYPDVVSVKQLQEMLGDISQKLAYKLIKENHFIYRKVGREYRIKKVSIIRFFSDDDC